MNIADTTKIVTFANGTLMPTWRATVSSSPITSSANPSRDRLSPQPTKNTSTARPSRCSWIRVASKDTNTLRPMVWVLLISHHTISWRIISERPNPKITKNMPAMRKVRTPTTNASKAPTPSTAAKVAYNGITLMSLATVYMPTPKKAEVASETSRVVLENNAQATVSTR
jgi:hypothetical protein